MAFELDDFKEEGLSLNDFEGESGRSVPVSEKNASLLAATDAALTGPSLEEYRKTKADLLDPQSRDRFFLRQELIRNALYEDSTEAAGAMIADAAVSEEVKSHALNGLAAGGQVQANPKESQLDMLATESAVTDAGVNETEAAANSRADTIDLIEAVNQSKIDTQKAINEVRANLTQGLVSTVVDIGEVMVPMAEWIHVDRLLKDVRGDATAAALGQQKQDLYNQIKALPIEKRAEFTERFIQLVEEHQDVVFPDGNAMLALDTLENGLIDDDYSNFERWFDNATSVLDVIGLGSAVRALGKGGKVTKASRSPGLDGEILGPDITPPRDGGPSLEGMIIDGEYEDITDRLANARIAATRTDVPTTSPSQVIKDVNPEQARNLHRMAVNDESGELAEALYGTSREEAAAKDLLPEPEVVKGQSPNKVVMDSPETEEPLLLREARNRDGNSYLSEVEVQRVRENLIAGLEDIEGMKVHRESLVVRTNDDATFGISSRYSPRDSGFRTPEEAMDNALYAFRNYRFDESAFTILGRVGDRWIEFSPQDIQSIRALRAAADKTGDTLPNELKITDYSVQLNTDYRFRPEDLQEWELLTTKRNFLDRFPTTMTSPAALGQGSLTQNVLDSASVLHPQIVQPTSVAVDRQFYLKALYVDTFNDFTQGYSKLPKDRRAMMSDYIHEANFKGLPLDPLDLANRGFNTEEVKLLREWRKSNDAMWYAANSDMAQTLRAKGNKVFVHSDSNTRLIGRPAPRNAVTDSTVAYDPVNNTVASVGDANSLYENGGEVIKLADPIQINGQWTDLAISRNTPQGGYTKAIGDNETVLAYRDGYYPVMYDAKWFITMKVRDPQGRTMTKVVASASNTEDRNRALEQLRAAHPDATFDARADKRSPEQQASSFDEGSFQLASASGFSAQRVRGERLFDAGVDLHKAGYTNLVDPLEAVAAQIQQMTTKVSMRPVLESMRARWMSNYGKYLDLPTDPNTGKQAFPRSIRDVNGMAETPSKMVADARSLFNYIYSMENGYINMIDEGYKGVLQGASNLLGEFGLTGLEKGLYEGTKISPTGAAKGAAFRLLLAANPARQLVIQSAQNLQLAPLNPAYFGRGLATDIITVDRARMGLTTDPKALSLLKEVEQAGLLTAVDAHNFIRDDLLKMADLTIAQRGMSLAKVPLNVSQKIGFDVAEQHVLLAAWLTFRDMAIKEGRNLKSQRVQDDIMGQTRAYTLNMNRSGDMPYARNSLALATQFFSVQHKALLQALFNRNLSRKDRAKVLAYTTALFGGEATLVSATVNSIFATSEPSPAKDLMRDGLLDYTLNGALTLASGSDQQIDWGDLAPAEAYGVGNAVVAMLTTDVGGMVANSPAGSLLFGNNPRISQAFKTGMRFFNVVEDYDDPEVATNFSDVVRASASLFSGYSSAFKSNYAFYTGTKMSSTGRITDEDVTKTEAALAFFGFQTKTESGYREVKELKFGDAEFQSNDVLNWYMDLKRHLARRGDRVSERDLSRRAFSEAWRVFGSDRPKAMNVILSQLQKDASSGDFAMLQGLIRDMGMMSPDEVWKMVNRLPAGQVRDRASEAMQAMEEQFDGS